MDNTDWGKVGGFLSGVAAVIVALIALSKACSEEERPREPATVIKQLSFCQTLDTLITEQRVGFRNIKQGDRQVRPNELITYDCSINLTSDSYLEYNSKYDKFYYRAFFSNNIDSLSGAKLHFKAKADLKICLSGWTIDEHIDRSGNFPFPWTQFSNGATRVTLYFRSSDPAGKVYVVGLSITE